MKWPRWTKAISPRDGGNLKFKQSRAEHLAKNAADRRLALALTARHYPERLEAVRANLDERPGLAQLICEQLKVLD
jgi:hypothetical protein